MLNQRAKKSHYHFIFLFFILVRAFASSQMKVGTCRACVRRLTKRTPSSLESEQEDIQRNTRAADNQGFVSTEEKKRENKTTKGEQGGGDDNELLRLVFIRIKLLLSLLRPLYYHNQHIISQCYILFSYNHSVSPQHCIPILL